MCREPRGQGQMRQMEEQIATGEGLAPPSDQPVLVTFIKLETGLSINKGHICEKAHGQIWDQTNQAIDGQITHTVFAGTSSDGL